MAFIDGIKEKAKADLKTIVLPESEDDRVITAAAEVLKEKTAKLVLLGNADTIKASADKLGVDVSGAQIVNPQTTEKLDTYVNVLYEARKHKGMTPEKAKETLLSDKTMFGVVMLKNSDADGMVSGACHSLPIP